MRKTVHVKHILVKYEYEAEDLLRKIKNQEDFSALAKKFSTCSSSQKGGDLGVIDIGRLDPDFAQAADGLQIGQISKPVRTRFGYHLILRLA